MVYLTHIEDQLTATSNAGAVVHAYESSLKQVPTALDGEGNPIESLSAQEGLTETGTTIAGGSSSLPNRYRCFQADVSP